MLRPQQLDGSVIVVIEDDPDLTDDPNLAAGTTESDIFHLTQSELDYLADGFYEFTVGDDSAGTYIQIGDPSSPSSRVTVKDPMVIRNPATGGHIDSYGELVGYRRCHPDDIWVGPYLHAS